MRRVSDLIAALSDQQQASYRAEIEAAVSGAVALKRTSYQLSHDRSWEMDGLRADGRSLPGHPHGDLDRTVRLP
jgi:coproporphyrinogen III oxidase-like Fe-S oxidoreductase